MKKDAVNGAAKANPEAELISIWDGPLTGSLCATPDDITWYDWQTENLWVTSDDGQPHELAEWTSQSIAGEWGKEAPDQQEGQVTRLTSSAHL